MAKLLETERHVDRLCRSGGNPSRFSNLECLPSWGVLRGCRNGKSPAVSARPFPSSLDFRLTGELECHVGEPVSSGRGVASSAVLQA
jgi:hypothetical protein